MRYSTLISFTSLVILICVKTQESLSQNDAKQQSDVGHYSDGAHHSDVVNSPMTLSRRDKRDLPDGWNDERQRHRNRNRGNRNRGNRATTTPKAPTPEIEPPFEPPHSVAKSHGLEPETATAMEQPYVNSSATCNECVRESRRKLRIKMIKEDLLRKLKLDGPPELNRTRNVTVLPFPMPLPAEPETQAGLDDMRNFIFAETPPSIDYIRDHGPPHMNPNRIAYFKLDDEVLDSTLHKAQLNLYIRPFHQPGGFSHLKLYKLSNDSTGRITKPSSPSIKRKILFYPDGGDTGGWYNVSFKEIAEDWKTRPSDNFGIYVELYDMHRNNLVVMDYDASEDEIDLIPLIHLEMSERHHGRSKRSQYNQMTCDERSKESRCCRYPLIIDFDEFGWEWILQPRQYAAFYCAGECSFAFYPNSAHSQLVMLQKNRDLPGGPCCTPVKMQRMSMIYYDDAMVIKQRVLDDMIVESCGCN